MGGSSNAARYSNVAVTGLLHLLALMRQGLQVHAGVLHFAVQACLQHFFDNPVTVFVMKASDNIRSLRLCRLHSVADQFPDAVFCCIMCCVFLNDSRLS